MLNQVVLGGVIQEIRNADKDEIARAMVVLRVERDKSGETRADRIRVCTWGGTTEYLREHCRIGDMIVVAGKLCELDDAEEANDIGSIGMTAMRVYPQNVRSAGYYAQSTDDGADATRREGLSRSAGASGDAPLQDMHRPAMPHRVAVRKAPRDFAWRKDPVRRGEDND